MSDFTEKIMKDVSGWSTSIASKAGNYIQSAIGKGEELTRKGKIQLQIEKKKRDFNKNMKELGKYIFDKTKIGVTDFSMDTSFLSLTEKLLNVEKSIILLKEDKNENK